MEGLKFKKGDKVKLLNAKKEIVEAEIISFSFHNQILYYELKSDEVGFTMTLSEKVLNSMLAQ